MQSMDGKSAPWIPIFRRWAEQGFYPTRPQGTSAVSQLAKTKGELHETKIQDFNALASPPGCEQSTATETYLGTSQFVPDHFRDDRRIRSARTKHSTRSGPTHRDARRRKFHRRAELFAAGLLHGRSGALSGSRERAERHAQWSRAVVQFQLLLQLPRAAQHWRLQPGGQSAGRHRQCRWSEQHDTFIHYA